MKKNLLIIVLFLMLGLSFYNQHVMSKEIDELTLSCQTNTIKCVNPSPNSFNAAQNWTITIEPLRQGNVIKPRFERQWPVQHAPISLIHLTKK